MKAGLCSIAKSTEIGSHPVVCAVHVKELMGSKGDAEPCLGARPSARNKGVGGPGWVGHGPGRGHGDTLDTLSSEDAA